MEPEFAGLVKGLDAEARKKVRDVPGRRKGTPIERRRQPGQGRR